GVTAVMSQHFVQAAVELGAKRNQDDRSSTICQTVVDVPQSTEVVGEMLDDIQADNRVEILILGKGFAARAVYVRHIHVRASGAKRFEVIQICRVYVCGPIGRT